MYSVLNSVTFKKLRNMILKTLLIKLGKNLVNLTQFPQQSFKVVRKLSYL